jgi:P pilus assembly chaperone PapD
MLCHTKDKNYRILAKKYSHIVVKSAQAVVAKSRLKMRTKGFRHIKVRNFSPFHVLFAGDFFLPTMCIVGTYTLPNRQRKFS